MASAQKKSNTLADFKAQFDPAVVVPNKIRTALASLLKEGAESWEYEADFCRRASVSQNQLALYRPQFEKHVVTVRVAGRHERKVWFADQKVAAKARAE